MRHKHITAEFTERTTSFGMLPEFLGLLLLVLGIWCAYTLSTKHVPLTVKEAPATEILPSRSKQYSNGLSKLRREMNTTTALLLSQELSHSLAESR